MQGESCAGHHRPLLAGSVCDHFCFAHPAAGVGEPPTCPWSTTLAARCIITTPPPQCTVRRHRRRTPLADCRASSGAPRGCRSRASDTTINDAGRVRAAITTNI
eukprot:4448831-Pyramimonas_sp.AAC.1